jgi:hypothetical protein
MTLASCKHVSDLGLPDEAKTFLRTYIQSLEQMEILALLAGTPERAFTGAAIYEAILSNERSILARLNQFVAQGLVVTTPEPAQTFRYAPRSADLDQAARATLSAYKDRRVLVIETIFRPETDAAKTFADAFRFKQP